MVIVAPDHPLAGAGTITIDDFCNLNLIGGEAGSGPGRAFSEALGERAARLRIVHTLGSTDAVKSAVRAGLGASVVLSAAVEAEVRAGFLRVLTIEGAPLTKTLHITCPEVVPDTANSKRLARLLLNNGSARTAA